MNSFLTDIFSKPSKTTKTNLQIWYLIPLYFFSFQSISKVLWLATVQWSGFRIGKNILLILELCLSYLGVQLCFYEKKKTKSWTPNCQTTFRNRENFETDYTLVAVVEGFHCFRTKSLNKKSYLWKSWLKKFFLNTDQWWSFNWLLVFFSKQVFFFDVFWLSSKQKSSDVALWSNIEINPSYPANCVSPHYAIHFDFIFRFFSSKVS